MPTAHLLRSLLPLTSVQLGRLVLNAKRPHEDFIDPLDGRPVEDDRQQSFFEKFTETRKFSKISKLRLGLGDIGQFSFNNLSTSEATLCAPNTMTNELNNSGEWFESACKEPRVQRWLEKAIDNGRTVYLIVGFRTVADARITSKDTRRKTPGVKTKIVIPNTLNSATLLEPYGEGVHSRVGGLSHAFLAPGDYAFAILYRKVRFSWLSSRKIDNMILKEGNRWKSFWDWRGAHSDDDDDDDVVEANLTDSDLNISDDEYLSEDDEIDSYDQEPPGIVDTENLRTEDNKLDTGCKVDGQHTPYSTDTQESVDKTSGAPELSFERNNKRKGSPNQAGDGKVHKIPRLA